MTWFKQYQKWILGGALFLAIVTFFALPGFFPGLPWSFNFRSSSSAPSERTIEGTDHDSLHGSPLGKELDALKGLKPAMAVDSKKFSPTGKSLSSEPATVWVKCASDRIVTACVPARSGEVMALTTGGLDKGKEGPLALVGIMKRWDSSDQMLSCAPRNSGAMKPAEWFTGYDRAAEIIKGELKERMPDGHTPLIIGNVSWDCSTIHLPKQE